MRQVYTIFLQIFASFLPLFSKRQTKFGEWVRVRHKWRDDLSRFQKDNGRKLVWFHCASVGEFEQARPVIDGLVGKGGFQIAVTFFSPSGYNARKDYPELSLVTYLPLDIPSNCRRFIELLQPDLAVFVKYELWFNFLHVLHQKAIPITLISAHFPHKHWTTQWPGIHLGQQLDQFERIFTQNPESCSRLGSVGIYNAVAVGDTRIDRVLDVKSESNPQGFWRRFSEGHRVLVIGSTWPEDDELLLNSLGDFENLRLIVAPHELNANQLENWKRTYRGQLQTIDDAEDQLKEGTKVIYVNRIGMLSKLYRYADVAYIGGGFGKAVHNTLEAAVYEIPVLFGPKNKRFLEIQDLKAMQAGIEIHDRTELVVALSKALNDEQYRLRSAKELRVYFDSQRGASQKIEAWIEHRLA